MIGLFVLILLGLAMYAIIRGGATKETLPEPRVTVRKLEDPFLLALHLEAAPDMNPQKADDLADDFLAWVDATDCNCWSCRVLKSGRLVDPW